MKYIDRQVHKYVLISCHPDGKTGQYPESKKYNNIQSPQDNLVSLAPFLPKLNLYICISAYTQKNR